MTPNSFQSNVARMAIGLLALVMMAGCGEGKGRNLSSGAPDPTDATESPAAHPITATPPEGFTLVNAGRGGWTQSWGDDSGGNDSPFTVVTDGSRTVTIASLGYESMQGKLDQAIGYSPEVETLKVSGESARFLPASDGVPNPILGVEKGDDLAISVTGSDMTKQELVDLAERVTPSPDHAVAPTVKDLPEPWKVVGSVGADLLGAAESYFSAGGESGPGPAAGYGLGFASGENQLTLTSLDGDAADLDALVPSLVWNEGLNVEGRKVDVGGTPGVMLERCHCDIPDNEYKARALVTHDPTGALVVVSASVQSVPDEQTLIDVAASVESVDKETWGSMVEETRMKAANGPGLNPDIGEAEVLRGTEGDLDWLLQTTHESELGVGPSVVDTCLKLSDYTRTCALPRGADQNGAAFYVAMAGEVKEGLRPFLILTIPTEAVRASAGASIRVTTQEGSGTAPLTAVPGTETSVAVVFVDDAGTPVCTTEPKPPESMKPMTVELLDADGRPAMCIGY